MRVLYFAWIRERIGAPYDDIDTGAATVADLITELRAREARYEAAFADTDVIRAAIDQQLVDMDASLKGAKEVAFFPPMTGG